MLQFLKILKLHAKLPLETVQYVFLLNLVVNKCVSPPSTKEFFTKERLIDASLVKSITLPGNTPVGLIAFFSQW